MTLLDQLKPATGGYKGSGTTMLNPTAAVTTPTSFTLSFPNGVSAIPKRIRVSGSVTGAVQLQYGAGDEISVPVNPNSAYTSALIPPGSFRTPVTQITMKYLASGAGSIVVMVDY